MRIQLMSCLVALGVASAAFAEDKAPAAGGAAAPAPAMAGMPDMTKFGPMAHMPKNEKQDKKELDAFWKAWEDAGKKGDINAMADMVAFPVMMVSDGAKGVGSMDMQKDAWIGMMKPFMDHHKEMAKDVKMTMKGTCFVLDDDFASCEGTNTMTGPKMKGSFNAQSLMVRVDGKWKAKSFVEAGWGDMPMQPPAAGGAGSGAAPTK